MCVCALCRNYTVNLGDLNFVQVKSYSVQIRKCIWVFHIHLWLYRGVMFRGVLFRLRGECGYTAYLRWCASEGCMQHSRVCSHVETRGSMLSTISCYESVFAAWLVWLVVCVSVKQNDCLFCIHKSRKDGTHFPIKYILAADSTVFCSLYYYYWLFSW